MPFSKVIYGVGLDSTEMGNPPSKFQRVFAKARDAGFAMVAHAWEEGPASYVGEAVEILQVQRIDRGFQVLEDPALTEELARRRIPFTLRPLSNMRLGVVNTMEEHR